MTDYKNIIKNIVKKIESYSDWEFYFVPRNEWIDIVEALPATYNNHAFTINIGQKDEPDDLDGPTFQDIYDVQFEIFFALELENDAWMDAIGHCEEAVKRIRDIRMSNTKFASVNPHYTTNIPNRNVIEIEFNDIFIRTQ